MAKKYLCEVRARCTYGPGGKIAAGERVEVTQAELDAFGDKLQLVNLDHAPAEPSLLVVRPEPEDAERMLTDAERELIEEALEVRVDTSNATDKAKELAGSIGIHLADVEGTGEDGRVLVKDVRARAKALGLEVDG